MTLARDSSFTSARSRLIKTIYLKLCHTHISLQYTYKMYKRHAFLLRAFRRRTLGTEFGKCSWTTADNKSRIRVGRAEKMRHIVLETAIMRALAYSTRLICDTVRDTLEYAMIRQFWSIMTESAKAYANTVRYGFVLRSPGDLIYTRIPYFQHSDCRYGSHFSVSLVMTFFFPSLLKF